MQVFDFQLLTAVIRSGLCVRMRNIAPLEGEVRARRIRMQLARCNSNAMRMNFAFSREKLDPKIVPQTKINASNLWSLLITVADHYLIAFE